MIDYNNVSFKIVYQISSGERYRCKQRRIHRRSSKRDLEQDTYAI
jgi:hypothetical protein